jgi:anti-sigma B factor antagonist
MEINIGMAGEAVVADLHGDLVASTAEEFKSQIAKLSDKNFRFILVEMSKVGFMDSSGLGACMAVHKMLHEKNGMVVWAKPSEAVGKVFRITRADKKLRVAATKQEGLNALHDATLTGGTK